MDFTKPSYRLGFSLAVLIIVGIVAVYYLSKGGAESEKTVPDAAAGAPLNLTLPAESTASQAQETMKKATHVILKTNHGELELELFPDKAPNTVANFLKLAENGFYSGTKFHRVIKGFMIQGGDPLSKDDSRMAMWGTGGPGYQFDDEINDQKIVRGVLAMANAGPGTNGSQFFIVTAGATPWLDGKHTVFGKVIRGMDTVDKIEKVETIEPGRLDRPKSPVIVEEIIIK